MIRPAPWETELLRMLASMPFLDRLELAAVTGCSRGGVYEGVRKLEDRGYAASVSHGNDRVSLTRRYHLTAAGLRRVGEIEEAGVEELLRLYPVSGRWRSILLERLDALAVIYRLAATVVNAATTESDPVRFHWYRAAPLDAGLILPGGRTLGILRQGPTADRTSFAKRVWRLKEGPLPGLVLLLVSDEVRLRHTARLVAHTPVNALLALESDAALAGPTHRIWRPPALNAALDLRYVLGRLRSGGGVPVETPPAQVELPGDTEDAERALAVLLKPAEKRALDLLADWPWLSRKELAGLLAVSEPRSSQILTPLEGFGLVARPQGRNGRLALTDRGLALLARRDRSSVGVAKKRWDVAPIDAAKPRGLAQRLWRQEPPTAQEPGAHRRRPRLHRCPGPAFPRPGLGGGPVRPARQGVPSLPPRRPAALRPSRCLRHPAPWPRHLGLLPGVGAPRRQARNDG